MAGNKFEKIARLVNVPDSIQPIPDWPQLPAFLKERFPDKAEELDAYHEKCVEFFKKASVIRGT